MQSKPAEWRWIDECIPCNYRSSFPACGKIYHFDATHSQDLQIGDQVVVETSRVLQLGEVTEFVDNPAMPPEGAWKSIHHKATPRDLVLRQLLQKKELEAMIKLFNLHPNDVMGKSFHEVFRKWIYLKDQTLQKHGLHREIIIENDGKPSRWFDLFVSALRADSPGQSGG